MSENYDIDQIVEITGLKIDFVKRCTATNGVIRPILDAHLNDIDISYGDHNQLLFSSNALIIFNRIAELKKVGHNINIIAEKLKKELEANKEEPLQDNLEDLQSKVMQPDASYTTLKSSDTAKIINQILDQSKNYQKKLENKEAELKDIYDQLKEKEKLIEVQKHQLLLLTDGRSPEEKKNELIEKEVNLQTLKFKYDELLKASNSTLHDFTKQQEEAEKLRKEKELMQQKEREKEEVEREKQLKRNKLLSELKALDSKWFSGSKRKEILKELEELN